MVNKIENSGAFVDIFKNSNLESFLSMPRSNTAVVDLWIDSFLTSAQDGGEWSTLRPARFNPYKEQWYTMNRRLGGPQKRCGRFGRR